MSYRDPPVLSKAQTFELEVNDLFILKRMQSLLPNLPSCGEKDRLECKLLTLMDSDTVTPLLLQVNDLSGQIEKKKSELREVLVSLSETETEVRDFALGVQKQRLLSYTQLVIGFVTGLVLMWYFCRYNF